GHVRLPGPYQGRDKTFRRRVGRAVATAAIDDQRGAGGRRGRSRRGARPSDPVERDPDLRDRMKAAGHAERLQRDLDQIEGRIDQHHRTLGSDFDAIIDILRRRGYVETNGDAEQPESSSVPAAPATATERLATWRLTAAG